MTITDAQFSALMERMRAHRNDIPLAASLSDDQFAIFCDEWHQSLGLLKQAVFTNDPHNMQDVQKFEYGWGAQSAQFMVDLIPRIQSVLLRHYRRADKLKLLDVGAGSCVGTSLLAMLHSDNFVYSTLQVDAVDYTPMRERWVRTQYPKINYRVADVFDLPERSWDLVVCSHVVEHVAEPRPFIDALRRICRGFAFVYSPFAEIDRIGGHQSTITDETYAGIPGCQLEHIKSMGWHPDRPEDQCLLAIIDCRSPA